ncbi:MAG TPA: hypothetical protein VL404_08055 [Candidatus Eisenbacteria bacterium]|nr:hypothetical protein [Candidatus Eisenbacteria bacterium]
MRKILAMLVFGALVSAPAWARDPDLEGRVKKMDVTHSVITVKNELENKIGKREYKVLVKQGMINDYKMNDKIRVWLMADNREASRIERVDR